MEWRRTETKNAGFWGALGRGLPPFIPDTNNIAPFPSLPPASPSPAPPPLNILATPQAGGLAGVAELGGSIVTGCDGNPLAVLALQVGGAGVYCVLLSEGCGFVR